MHRTTPSSLGNIILTGAAITVGLMFAARWYVAWDYRTLDVGDPVMTTGTFWNDARNPPVESFDGHIMSFNGEMVTIKEMDSEEIHHIPLVNVREL